MQQCISIQTPSLSDAVTDSVLFSSIYIRLHFSCSALQYIRLYDIMPLRSRTREKKNKSPRTHTHTYRFLLSLHPDFLYFIVFTLYIYIHVERQGDAVYENIFFFSLRQRLVTWSTFPFYSSWEERKKSTSSLSLSVPVANSSLGMR